MNIYVRRNMVKDYWEMCLDTERTNWIAVTNIETKKPISRLNIGQVKEIVKTVWSELEDNNINILMTAPLRKIEETHRYYT